MISEWPDFYVKKSYRLVRISHPPDSTLISRCGLNAVCFLTQPVVDGIDDGVDHGFVRHVARGDRQRRLGVDGVALVDQPLQEQRGHDAGKGADRNADEHEDELEAVWLHIGKQPLQRLFVELLQAFLHGIALAVGCAVVAEVQEHRIPGQFFKSFLHGLCGQCRKSPDGNARLHCRQFRGRLAQCRTGGRRVAANDGQMAGFRVDAIVNIAGGAFGVDRVEAADLDHWKRMYEVNVLGTTRVTQALLPLVRANGSGSVVVLTSTAAQDAYVGGGGYNAAKAAERTGKMAVRHWKPCS